MNGIYDDLLLRYPALEQCGDSIRAGRRLRSLVSRRRACRASAT